MQHEHLLLKGMLDDALIDSFHVMPKPHLWIMRLLQTSPF